MQSVLWVILISLDYFSLQFYPANSLNIFEIFYHNSYNLHLFIAHTITISLSSDLSNFFVSAHVTYCLLLYAVHAIPTSTWMASLAKWLTLTVATSTQNTAYMTRSILFGQLQLGHRCYVFTKSGKRGDSVDILHIFFFHKGVSWAGWWPVPCACWLNLIKLAYLSIGLFVLYF